MNKEFYLKPYLIRKVDTYCYEYDNFDSGMTGLTRYYVDIIFTDGKFDRLQFNKEKKFFDYPTLKELKLIEKINLEIAKIEKEHYNG